MKKNKVLVSNFIIVILMFINSIWVYSRLPEKVASHWDTQGQVNGYMSRFGGAFFMPFLILGIFLFLMVIPNLDPKKNIAKFKDVYNIFITIFLLYMFYIHSLTLAFNLGHKFDFTRAILPAFGVLFYYIGWMLSKARPNWFIGIRTPWTLSSDTVWGKTHILGGKLFKISGILALFGFFLPKYSFFFILIPVIASSIYLVVYSYFEFKNLKK